MLTFEKWLDHRTREVAPQVAKLVYNGDTKYVIVGTQYGHIHTTSGDVRTWKTASGARKFLKRYEPF